MRTSESETPYGLDRTRRKKMFRNVPILALAMTAGLAALLLSGLQIESADSHAIHLDSDAWFI